ncbi:vancomycin high temperature exclusion protein [Emticicia sp. TH156]|uniref:SanA/YdcF family protein n=1 Tax=Emticicia sp. TH156 TaxID=2067454 RepID=UPI000C793C23|nr:ElyC/SanA/YdcF family protein [Emticicia sp. TH156]PLK43556.1 protein SanA [Emticicia sp. TH156]
MKKKKLILWALSGLMLLSVLVIYVCDALIKETARGRLYSDINSIPYTRVGLLLGTGKYTKRSGELNAYYIRRIKAATSLMEAGKIKYLVISGDNSRKDYNEPEMMREDLVKAGVDSTRIYLDYAGFRTFDSMVRLKKIFGQDSVTIISQLFHNERAIYIASKEGIIANGFNAEDAVVEGVMAREKLARVKVFVDYLMAKEPRFLGEKINLPD